MRQHAIAAALALAISVPALAQVTLPRPSPNATVKQLVGVGEVTVSYSRPGVKDRKIWGELVPYDKVWRTGANEATIVTFSQDVKVNGSELKAGSYSLHTIPTTGDWTVIFNSAADPKAFYSYDETKNVLKVTAKPMEHAMTERLTFSFPKVEDSGASLVMAWEKLAIELKIEVDTQAAVMAQAKTMLEDWRPAFQAANYAWEKGAKADAMKWIDQSVAAKESLANLTLKSRMLADAGKTKEAIATVEKAITVGKAANANTANAEKLLAEWKAAATKGGKKK
ncbi:MAG: DUF2911 domain-containing protein [Thermoanaerobaculia bacterium]|nr:DUF2911 domain-containing protein [Thermoanaerobaculia bacterium]